MASKKKSKAAHAVTKRRIEMKLSKAALARKCGLQVITIKRLEADKVSPRLETLLALAKVMDMSLADLLP